MSEDISEDELNRVTKVGEHFGVAQVTPEQIADLAHFIARVR